MRFRERRVKSATDSCSINVLFRHNFVYLKPIINYYLNFRVRLMRIVCGLDVYKDSIFLCILNSTGEIFEKKFGVLTNQLEEMRDLMLKHHV